MKGSRQFPWYRVSGIQATEKYTASTHKELEREANVKKFCILDLPGLFRS